jgi:hypothetical protein
LAALSMSMSLPFLDVVAQAGDQNARVKEIANCNEVLVPAQLHGRVSSKGPLQYHKTLALSTKSVD